MTFDRLCKQYLVEMNRRDFLGKLGKGAAAVTGSKVIPAGLMKAATTGLSPSTAIPGLDKLLFNFIHTMWPYSPIKSLWHRGREPQMFENMWKYALKLFDLSDNLPIEQSKAFEPLSFLIQDYDRIMDDYLDTDLSNPDDFRFMINQYYEFMENEGPEYLPQLLASLKNANLLTPALLNQLKTQLGLDVDAVIKDHLDEQEYQRNREQQKQKAKLEDKKDKEDIANSQSRFDKAGGSEDVGYAQHYESYMKKFSR